MSKNNTISHLSKQSYDASVSHLQKSEACEADCVVKKKKKKEKKEKDACVDTTESVDLTESCENKELNGKKKETHKTKV